MSKPLDPDIAQLLAKNKKIEAIKKLRERTKVGLAEAKSVVDAFEHNKHVFANTQESPQVESHGVYHRAGLGPGEVPAPKHTIVKFALLLMLFAAGIYYLLRG
jgi:hypothetical protein